MIVNTANTIVWRWENTHAFGANLPDEDPDGNAQLFEYHPRFPGQYFDRETNMHYNYFRYYEPEIGRYVSPDPIGLMGGINVYGYVEQNPLSLIDPTGEAPPEIAGIITATVAACRAAASGVSKLISNLTKKNTPNIDPNKLDHIFGQPKHNLDGLLKQFSFQEKAFNAIQKATEGTDRSQRFRGNFETSVKVGTENIKVR